MTSMSMHDVIEYFDRAVEERRPAEKPSALETLAQAVLDGRVTLEPSHNFGGVTYTFHVRSA